MVRESEIGHDPLGWMKAAKDMKMGQSVNTSAAETYSSPASAGHAGVQPALNQQIPTYSSKNNPSDVQKPVQQRQENVGAKTDTATTHGPKVVIGRLYDKASQEKEKKPLPAKDKANEIRPHIEQPLSEIDNIQGFRRQSAEIKPFPFSSSSQLSIYFIVGYTVLLLILGYFVFSDFSRRAKNIEARISSLERVIQERMSISDEHIND